MNPCNAGIQPLVDRAMAALEEAGAMPQVFGVPTVTDGIGMGTEGMKYSLVSREVIADAIETAVNGQCMDGVLVVGGCDKNMPGGMMAMARMNVPGIFVYARHHQAGPLEGQGRSPSSSPFEAVGAFTAGKMSKEDFDGIEKQRLPERRRVRRHVHREHDVVVVRGARHEPARLARRWRRPTPRRPTPPPSRRACWSRRSSNDLKPRDIITRKSIENAIALVMATGGSTNAVLHYLAIASAAGVQVDASTTSSACARKVPVLCDLKPSGRYVAVDFHARRRRAAGAEDAARRTASLHGDCMTITGKTHRPRC